MKIERVETFPVILPMRHDRVMKSSYGRQWYSEFVVVRLTTNSGHVGLGEASVSPFWSGESSASTVATIEKLFEPRIHGHDPFDIPELNRRLDQLATGNWFAKAAIEMACWDIQGRVFGKPVYELLGGACRPLTIRSRFSLGAFPPEAARKRAGELVALGFRTIKIKVGTDPAADLERVRSVREEVGDAIELTVDANGGWSEEGALWSVERMMKLGVEWVEQPFPRGRHRLAFQLRGSTGCKIIADESVFDLPDLYETLEQGACDAVSLYPGKQGGIAKAKQFAEIVSAIDWADIPCSIGSNLEFDLGTAAMLHLVVATPGFRIENLPGDCIGPSYYAESLAVNPVKIDGPLTTLEPRPGLGIDLDWDKVEYYQFKSST